MATSEEPKYPDWRPKRDISIFATQMTTEEQIAHRTDPVRKVWPQETHQWTAVLLTGLKLYEKSLAEARKAESSGDTAKAEKFRTYAEAYLHAYCTLHGMRCAGLYIAKKGDDVRLVVGRRTREEHDGEYWAQQYPHLTDDTYIREHYPEHPELLDDDILTRVFKIAFLKPHAAAIAAILRQAARQMPEVIEIREEDK